MPTRTVTGPAARRLMPCARHVSAAGDTWVLDIDIKAFFDSIPHELLLKAVQFHYRTFIPTTDCSVPVPRIGTRALAGASRLSFSLGIGATGSRVPQKSLIRVHAASKPGAVRAGLQGSAQTHPRGHYLPPGFDTVL